MLPLNQNKTLTHKVQIRSQDIEEHLCDLSDLYLYKQFHRLFIQITAESVHVNRMFDEFVICKCFSLNLKAHCTLVIYDSLEAYIICHYRLRRLSTRAMPERCQLYKL